MKYYERVRPAGVEDDEAQLAGSLDLGQHAVERQRLVGDVAVALEPGVGRNEVGGAADLDAVAGVVDDRPVGVRGLVTEGLQCVDHGRERKVVALDDVGKAEPPQAGGDGAGVVGGVGETLDRAADGVANHKRHTPPG